MPKLYGSIVGIYCAYFIGKIIITLSERLKSAIPMIFFFILSFLFILLLPIDRKFLLAKPNETSKIDLRFNTPASTFI